MLTLNADLTTGSWVMEKRPCLRRNEEEIRIVLVQTTLNLNRVATEI